MGDEVVFVESRDSPVCPHCEATLTQIEYHRQKLSFGFMRFSWVILLTCPVSVMRGKPPPPLVQAFVVCREIYEAPKSKDLALVAPFSGLTLPRYPGPLQFSVYAHLTEARGRYSMGLHLEDSDGQVVWAWDLPTPRRRC
jgi:hypothetical protein